ncbi:hypothetical protein EDD85DRAFT_957896 [Armillaria nabsnona]|nr:hypothetical protein EDD85DRAFT_957896 [Armillaria nabsnona]
MKSSSIFLNSIVARHDWLLTFTHSPTVTLLLSTNDPPSCLQSAQLNASIERFSAVLPELQNDLDTLRKAVAFLEAQMSRLLSLKRESEAILSPFHRLPPEMLMEILRRSWTRMSVTQTQDVICIDLVSTFSSLNVDHGILAMFVARGETPSKTSVMIFGRI